MSIIAALPFEPGNGGELIWGNTAGFHLLKSELKSLGDKTADRQTILSGVDAIPSSIAHLIKIHSDMANDNLEVRYKEEQWRKVMLIWVLSKYRAYDIKLEKITAESCNQYVWNIIGDKLVKETGMIKGVRILQFRGKNVALFDRKGYLLPIVCFPPEIELELGVDCIENLEDYEKDILFSFLEELSANTFSYTCYINSFRNDLRKSGAKKVDIIGKEPVFKEEIFVIEEGTCSQGEKCFQNIPCLPLDLPPAFHSKLILGTLERRGKEIKGFGEKCSFQFEAKKDGIPFLLSGFLPLSESMVDFLEENKSVSLDYVAVNSDTFEKSQQLMVHLSFFVQGVKIVLKRCYEKDEIEYVDSVPMISLFPYVNLPDNVWKKYYLVMLKGKEEKREKEGNEKEMFLDTYITISGKDINFAEKDIRYCSTVAGRKEDMQSWYYKSMNRIPRFIKLGSTSEMEKLKQSSEKQGGYLGCISVGEPDISPVDSGGTYIFALDIGTRNTIAAWKNENMQEISYCLARNGIYHTLLLGMGNMDRNFARECYAPIQEIVGSFPTMARIYAKAGEETDNICYEQGCALFPDLELIGGLLEKDKDWEKAAIFTDIKLGAEDENYRRALRIFLSNMLWLGSLEAALNGAKQLEIRISYPRKSIRDRIEEVLKAVKEEIGQISSVTMQEPSYYLEAEANARYLQKVMRKNMAKRISRDSIFGTCDIGDGTSDFNLYLGRTEGEELPERIQFSMRYAGRDILVNTIMRFAKKYPGDFSKLWRNAGDTGNKQKLIEIYEGLQKMDNEESSVKNQRKIFGDLGAIRAQESRRNIILTLIENIGLRGDFMAASEQSLLKFAAILRFKYWNLFCVYGNMMNKFLPEAISFRLFIYGGGRKGLEIATGASLGKFDKTDFGRDVIDYLRRQAKVEETNFLLDLTADNMQKTEVVEGMLEKEDKSVIKSEPYSGREDVDKYYVKKSGQEQIMYESAITKKFLGQLREGYQEYIQEVNGKKYFILDEKAEMSNIYKAISTGDVKDEKQSMLEKQNYSIFCSLAENIWYDITEDDENPKCLWKVLFYLKMSDEILMKNIFGE